MPIRDAAHLRETVSWTSRNLQAIQDFVATDDVDDARVRFPRGYIRRAEVFQQQFWFVEPDHLRRNISYALMLDDVHRWIIGRTDLSGVAQEMVLKDSLVLLGNIAEVLTQVPLTTAADQKKDFRKRLWLLTQKGAIDSDLSGELSWLWDTRCRCHFSKVTERELSHYRLSDYDRGVATLERLTGKLSAYFQAAQAAGCDEHMVLIQKPKDANVAVEMDDPPVVA